MWINIFNNVMGLSLDDLEEEEDDEEEEEKNILTCLVGLCDHMFATG